MRYNKKRNSALLYEFLVRKISESLVNKDKATAAKAMEISKKYFSKGSVLREELNLFKTLLNTEVKSKASAQRILNEVLSGAEKMNSRHLDTEKSKLIREINYSFDDKFYKYKIPDYKIYGSIYMLLNEKRNKKRNLSEVDKIKLEDTLVEHLVSKRQPSTKLKVDPNYNNAVFKFVVERFHKKYNNKLTEKQRGLMTKYVLYLISEDRKILDEAIQRELATVKKALMGVGDVELLRDKDLTQQLRECYSRVSKIDFSEIDDNKMMELLKYVKLAEEVVS